MALGAIAEGHHHSEDGQCPALVDEDDQGRPRYGWGLVQIDAHTRTWSHWSDRCLVYDPEIIECARLGRKHDVDFRVLDVDLSSECEVDLVLTASSWWRQHRGL